VGTASCRLLGQSRTISDRAVDRADGVEHPAHRRQALGHWPSPRWPPHGRRSGASTCDQAARTAGVAWRSHHRPRCATGPQRPAGRRRGGAARRGRGRPRRRTRSAGQRQRGQHAHRRHQRTDPRPPGPQTGTGAGLAAEAGPRARGNRRNPRGHGTDDTANPRQPRRGRYAGAHPCQRARRGGRRPATVLIVDWYGAAGPNGPVQAQQSLVRLHACDGGEAASLTLTQSTSCCDQRDDLLIRDHDGWLGRGTTCSPGQAAHPPAALLDSVRPSEGLHRS